MAYCCTQKKRLYLDPARRSRKKKLYLDPPRRSRKLRPGLLLWRTCTTRTYNYTRREDKLSLVASPYCTHARKNAPWDRPRGRENGRDPWRGWTEQSSLQRSGSQCALRPTLTTRSGQTQTTRAARTSTPLQDTTHVCRGGSAALASALHRGWSAKLITLPTLTTPHLSPLLKRPKRDKQLYANFNSLSERAYRYWRKC